MESSGIISDSGNFESEMTARIKTNREAILKELRTVYSRKGMTEYAPRMGKLLFLLANEEVFKTFQYS